MKTISIKQLHHATGRYVRSAATEPLVVTDRGANVAILKAFSPGDLPVRPFPVRSVADLPAVGIDSTTVISDDRDGR